MEDLGEGRKAVGGARGVRDDGVLGLVGVKVDTADEHRGVGRGGRDDDLLGAALEVDRGGGLRGEDTGRLDNVVGAGRAPLDVGGVTLREDGDGLALDDELAVLGLNSALENTYIKGRRRGSSVKGVARQGQPAAGQDERKTNRGSSRT